MDLRTEGIAGLLSGDKRKSDRLIIPLVLFLSLPQDQAWTGPLQIDDIGGNGLKFSYHHELETGAEFNIKLSFPEPTERAIDAKAKVSWCKLKNPTTYFIGLQIISMSNEDRKRFVMYICDKIVLSKLKKD